MMHSYVFDSQEYTLEDTIKFHCYKGIICFNQCCYDVKLVLSPYEFLRLRKALNLGIQEFIEKYGEVYLGEVTQLPVISVNMDPYSFACPFLNEKEGCKIYKDRPASCRLYPLARYLVKNKEGKNEEIFKVIRETHCKGHYENRPIKIKDYLKEQDLGPYLFFNDLWGEVVIKRQKFSDTPLTEDILDLIFTLAYDLEEFRILIKKEEINDFFLPEMAELPDEKLLELGLKYIRDKILTEETLI